LVITLSSVIILLAAMIFAMTHSAAAGTVCLSKKEARQLWQKRHIWWYRDKQTGDRCWSNRRGGPPQNLKLDPILNNTSTLEFSFAKLLPAPVYDQLPRPRPQIMQSDPPDDCCWPSLDQLLAEQNEMPLRLLLEKLKQK
jgi:hypothetical protein